MKAHLVTAMLAVAAAAASVVVNAATPATDPALSLDEYLNQVRSNLPGYKGFAESAEGAKLRADEGSLVTTPNLFFNGQWVSDSKLPTIPVFNYEKVKQNFYSLGVSQRTSFGLDARLSYAISYLNYINPTLADGTPTSFPAYHDTTPMIELTQSLWGNGFGASTRAQVDLSNAQALAASHNADYQSRSELAEAEAVYWRMVLARRTVAISRDALDRAKKIEEWSSRRARLHLADLSDALQAKAALQLRQLDLQNALDIQRASAREFNHRRNGGDDTSRGALEGGSEAADVSEKLEDFDISKVKIPEANGRLPERGDVRAAEQNDRAVRANADIARERDLPTLELFGSYALNGRAGPVGPALSDPFSAGRPTTVVGVRFSAPLDVGLIKDARAGWAREKAASDLAFQQKRLDLAYQWGELERRMGEARDRLKLSVELERTQEQKLTNERNRYNSGRTTTYQVLQFEQDYASSQLSRIRAEADVLTLAAQMRVYDFPKSSANDSASASEEGAK